MASSRNHAIFGFIYLCLAAAIGIASGSITTRSVELLRERSAARTALEDRIPVPHKWNGSTLEYWQTSYDVQREFTQTYADEVSALSKLLAQQSDIILGA